MIYVEKVIIISLNFIHNETFNIPAVSVETQRGLQDGCPTPPGPAADANK